MALTRRWPTSMRRELEALISSGEEKARKLTRARILLKADEGWTDRAISEALDSGRSTVERVRKRFVHTGLEAINRRKPRRRKETQIISNLSIFIRVPFHS